ncbi:hypothetical protein FB567DRAFT_56039 [Paraphoma chrysanthemicola]|uniref:Uncharacterized protein n=1 Tax=Paraphoma chrysanthemicola TaxID=798071 RepID=A0A8K0R4S4_9PLEO|nr:hypothetical protein FB567DRAFT_56039 [Paraphoma chrysanthemicola]
MALGADLTAHPPPVRIPKLKYRNPLPADEPLPSPQTRRDSANSCDARDPIATAPSIASSSRAPSSDYRQSFETASLTSGSLASTASSVSSSNDSKSSTKKKKKPSGVLGFLSLKEPSQDALKQFADAQRKQAADKGTSTPGSSQPSSIYAAKKLPENIPKVNSKWDGIPESAKHRYSKSGSSSSDRPSISSRDSRNSQLTTLPWNGSKFSVMTDGTRNPPNSIASAANSLANFDITDNARSTSPSPSTTTLPEMSYYFPEPLVSGALPVQNSTSLSYRSSTSEATPRQSSEFDFRPESPASSTGSVDTIVKDTADVIFKKLNDAPVKNIWGDAPAVQPPAEEYTAVPESHDFLFGGSSVPESSKADSPMASPMASPMSSPAIAHYAPSRPVQNFSRPISSHGNPPPARPISTSSYRTTPRTSGLPTLYEASLASTESDETVQDERDDATVQGDGDDDSYSIAPSTIAPSVLSAHWLDSPRERLGLGGRLRMNDPLPWEAQREPPGKLKKYRLSMFGKATPRA